MAIEIEVEKEDGEEKTKKYGKYDDYEIENAARTLMEADEIKADKEKMKYVVECMKKKTDSMSGIITSFADLKKIAYKKT